MRWFSKVGTHIQYFFRWIRLLRNKFSPQLKSVSHKIWICCWWQSSLLSTLSNFIILFWRGNSCFFWSWISSVWTRCPQGFWRPPLIPEILTELLLNWDLRKKTVFYEQTSSKEVYVTIASRSISNMTPYLGKCDNLATNFLEGDPHSQKSVEIMQYINTVTVNV